MAIKKFFIKTQQPGYLYDRNAKKWFSYGFDIWLGPNRVQERGFHSREMAELAAAKLKREYKAKLHGMASEVSETLLIELFQSRLDSISDRKERVRCKRAFKFFLSIVPDGIKVTDLKRSHLQQFYTERLKTKHYRDDKPITPQTAIREMNAIKAALNVAGTLFEDLENWTPPRIPSLKIEKSGRDTTLEPDAIHRILEQLHQPRKTGESLPIYQKRRATGYFVQFLLLTLARPGEAAALRDSDVFETHVNIRGTKTRFRSKQSVRRVPMTPLLRETIDGQKANQPELTDFIFTSKGYVNADHYEQMKMACEAAGVPYGVGKGRVTFHSCRHTGVTMMITAGVDLKTIGSMSGHSDARMTLYYTHTTAKLAQAAADKLASKLTFFSHDREYLESDESIDINATAITADKTDT